MIRGQQLGAAIKATVQPMATDFRGVNLVVLVKRPKGDLVQRIHGAGVPLIWDVVDAWPQPAGNAWGREQCMEWLRDMVGLIRPAAIVAATQAMARDCAEFGTPVLALPHHARPRMERTPIRPLRTVGYEGAEAHLGRWAETLRAECQRRGLAWVVNPDSLSELDIVVALRELDGYAARNWKSNVKAANAQASGTPVICGREAGYLETASGAERWADTAEEVAAALDELAPVEARRQSAEIMVERAPRLADVAATYRAWLELINA